ncbi:MAG: transketolase, partial [Clostridia bacterium]|nr:transketolase [Clostridia bacterium]
YFPKEVLKTLNQSGTTLPSHCEMNKTPGVDMTAGSLGQGFSCAVGCAIGSKLKGDGATIYAIIGDGESQEGQIWEAAMYAGHSKLDNFIAFTDYNKMQLDNYTDNICSLNPLDKKWEAFGWKVWVVDGHDVDALDEAITEAKAHKGQPKMIIMNTIKGKGVTYCESALVGSHSMSVSSEQREQGIKEVRGE